MNMTKLLTMTLTIMITITGTLTVQSQVALPGASGSVTFETEAANDSAGVSFTTNGFGDPSGTYGDNFAESAVTGTVDGASFIRFDVSGVDDSLTYELNFRHRRNGGGVNDNEDAFLEVYSAVETSPDVFTYTSLGTMTAIWISGGWNANFYYQSASDPDATVTDIAQAATLDFTLAADTTHLYFEFGQGVGTSTAHVDNFTITAVPEPSTFALLMGALGGWTLLARRRARG